MFYSYNDLKHDIKHDRLMILCAFGIVAMFFWLLIPLAIVRKLVDAYKYYGRDWFILSTVNFICSGITIAIALPYILDWFRGC